MEAIQDDTEPSYFYALPDGLAIFDKNTADIEPVSAFFQNSVQPSESNNIDWRNVRFKVKYKTDNPSTSNGMLIQLWGGLQDGTEQLIYERQLGIINTIEYVTNVNFELTNSSTLPELFYRQQQPGLEDYRCQLALPLRWLHYNTVKIYPAWIEGYAYCKVIRLTGSNIPPKVVQNQIVPITVTYDSGMKSDFSDIRFIDSNGKTFLCHERYSYTPGTSALFNVLVPVIPGYPEIKPIMMFFGNNNAGTASNPFRIQFYDDFEDGKTTTGRTGPYHNWTNSSGLFVPTSTNPINGVYSAKLTGNNDPQTAFSYVTLASSYFSNNYVFEFDVKLLSHGTGTYSPQFGVMVKQDDSNYLRAYTFYDSGSNKQKLNVQEIYNGVTSAVGGITDFLTDKLPTNTTYKFRLTNTGTSFKLEINNTTYINTSYNPRITPLNIGFTAWWDEQILFDNIRFKGYQEQQPSISFSGRFTNTAQEAIEPTHSYYQFVDFPIKSLIPIPSYVYVDEIGVEGVTTNTVPLLNKGMYGVGPDGIDKYVSLKLKNYVKADKTCNIEFYDFKYEYEVLE